MRAENSYFYPAVVTAANCLQSTAMSWRAGVNRKVASCLTVLPHKTRVLVEVVTTFSSFQVP
jgi:hypothetical protein